MNSEHFCTDRDGWKVFFAKLSPEILNQLNEITFTIIIKNFSETFASKHIIWFRIRTFSIDVSWNKSFVIAHHIAIKISDSKVCSQPFFEMHQILLNFYKFDYLQIVIVHWPDRFMCIGDRLYSITFGDRLYSTTFGDRLYSTTFGDRLNSAYG